MASSPTARAPLSEEAALLARLEALQQRAAQQAHTFVPVESVGQSGRARARAMAAGEPMASPPPAPVIPVVPVVSPAALPPIPTVPATPGPLPIDVYGIYAAQGEAGLKKALRKSYQDTLKKLGKALIPDYAKLNLRDFDAMVEVIVAHTVRTASRNNPSRGNVRRRVF